MELDQDFKEFIVLLNEHQVEYLIVGGYAVVAYGYHRFTGDLDVWIKPSKANAEKVLRTLKAFGFGKIKLTSKDLSEKDKIIQLGYEPLRIDLITSVEGLNFENSYKRRKRIKADGVIVQLIGLDDLRKNKKLIGRDRDREDYKHLKNI
jgi:predicted nucleotidyltransferase